MRRLTYLPCGFLKAIASGSAYNYRPIDDYRSFFYAALHHLTGSSRQALWEPFESLDLSDTQVRARLRYPVKETLENPKSGLFDHILDYVGQPFNWDWPQRLQARQMCRGMFQLLFEDADETNVADRLMDVLNVGRKPVQASQT